MVCVVKSMTAFLAKRGSISSVHMAASRGSGALFFPPRVPYTYMVHRLTCRQNMSTYKIK